MIKTISSIFFGLLLFTLSLFISNQQTFAAESIRSFYSMVEINQDTSLSITEQLDYTTTVSKHGIYRYIPISYNKDGQVEVLDISHIQVTDELGNQIPFTRTSNNKFVNIKIGDPDVTFIGEKKYVIYYQVERGINQFEDHNELYWDITGEGWQVPILQSSATIISKFADIQQAECYSGPFGGDDGLCNFETGTNQATFTYLNQIDYGDNMTVVLSFPKNSQLIFPTQSKLLMMWIVNNWPILLLPFPLIIIFFRWYTKGRDIEFISQNVFDIDPNRPTRISPIKFSAREPMVYEPLKDLSPGEAGALIDDRVGTQDIVAEILELARKRYLKVSVEEKKVLFSKSRDYTFEKLSGSTQELNDVQTYLLTEIFRTGDVVKLSNLKGKFHTVMSLAGVMIKKSLTSKGVYTSSTKEFKGGTVSINPSGIGIVLYIFMSAMLFYIFKFKLSPLGINWPFVVLFIQAPFGLFIASKLTQKSAVGTNLWLQTRGLRATIKRGAWREKINEKNLFIEEVLPYAVALGVVKQLANDMQELQIEPPEYLSTTNLKGFLVADFVSNFSNEVGSTLAYNPSSSSSSGGSGFSGGSSGGGGGGGGGGSW